LNWKTFIAMLSRDGHVARRNLVPTLLQNLLQPLLLTFVFGRVLTSSGLMAGAYKNILLPGVMALSMTLSGIWAVAMPLISEFQFTKEIEDRLLAPIDTGWLAVEKVVAGMIQALFSGLVVIPAAWLTLGSGVNLGNWHPVQFISMCLLMALFSAAGGLWMGVSVGQTQIGLMFSMVITPMIMFGCAYYPWSALNSFPLLKYLVLINPMVYASEGMRGSMVPQVPHMPAVATIGALLLIDGALLALGISKFNKKAVS
jgi:ABC-2 type transport system permease protein